MKYAKTLPVILSASLLLGGCGSAVKYEDPTSVETTTVDFGSTDLQTVAKKMVDGLLSFPPIVQLTAKKRPVVFVDDLKNSTQEHIDTSSINNMIMTELIQSGKFRFVDMSAVDNVRTQLRYQKESGLIDPTTAVRVGKQIGAQFMIYGSISSIVKRDGRTTDIYYLVSMRMMNLQTGIVEWADQKQIRKTQTKGVFGW